MSTTNYTRTFKRWITKELTGSTKLCLRSKNCISRPSSPNGAAIPIGRSKVSLDMRVRLATSRTLMTIKILIAIRFMAVLT